MLDSSGSSKISKAFGATPALETTRNLLPIDLAIDADRNGTIASGETASQAKPFRFWINNDSDHYDEEETIGGPANSIYDGIEGVRDLEDFTRVKLTLPPSLVEMAKLGQAQLGFCWEGMTGNVRAKLYAVPADTGRKYLDDWNTAVTLQSAHGGSANRVDVWSSTPGDINSVFPAGWLDKFSSSGELLMLLEGVESGAGKLTVCLKMNGAWQKGAGVHLKLMDVKAMFQRGKAHLNNRSDPNGVPNPYADPTPGAMAWASDDLGQPFEQDPDETAECVVHVHGWRMTEEESENWAEMSFKRLWQIGYKGRFAAFRWPTFSGPFGGYTTYNPSEYRSWLSGPARAAFVNQLPHAGSRHLMAHSMGNVISGSALRSGMQVTSYAMLNSAMSSLAYDDQVPIDYPLFASPDSPAETVPSIQAVGLKNKISLHLNGATLLNFYLPNDSALRSWTFSNAAFKPEGGLGYRYRVGDGVFYETFDTSGSHRRYLTNPNGLYEAMGYGVVSRTVTAGANGQVNGAVTTKVNMQNEFQFGDMHSAEWVKPIQKTHAFWEKIAESFQLDVFEQ